MHFSTPLLALIPALSFSLAAPTLPAEELYLPDGLPNPNADQLLDIERRAHGTLPGLRLPATISTAGVANLQLMTFTAFQDVAFFSELVRNVTQNVTGYALPDDAERNYTLRSLEPILAQREIHALAANGALQHFGKNFIQPCRYQFPVSTLRQAIEFAATSASFHIGHLQDMTERFAANGDLDLIRLAAAMIGNEGQQEGWFRVFLDKYPTSTPLPTTSDVHLAFTAAQTFVVPSSCPNIHEIDLKTFMSLEIVTTPEPKTHKIQVSWTHAKIEPKEEEVLWLAYVNQLNVPAVVPLKVVSCDGQKSTAVALWPYEEYTLNGLTLAAVVNRRGPFASATAVAHSTVYGPGLIVVE
ncbi:hypothetical protein BJX99DRAFT_270653 [Aspergillus californicus]